MKFMILFTLMMIFAASAQATRIAEIFMTGEYHFVSPTTIFNEKTETEFALWGLSHPSEDPIGMMHVNNDLGELKLTCTWMDKVGEPKIAHCTYGHPRRILANDILLRNLALEDCEQTQGQFGSC